MTYFKPRTLLSYVITAVVLTCGLQSHLVKAQDDYDGNGAPETNPPTVTDPTPDTTPGSGNEHITWTNANPSSGTVSPGDNIAADLAVSGLDPNLQYHIMVGKTEGERSGGWDFATQKTGVCTDIQNGVNTATYGARAFAIADITGYVSQTYGTQSVDTTRTLTGDHPYRIWAILFDDTVGSDRCADRIVAWSAKGFGGATDVSGGGGSGNTGGNVTVTTTPANFTPEDVGNGGNVGNTSGSAGNIAAITAAATATDSHAFCEAMTIRLPGNGGTIDLGKAGILGLCNTRPLLVNTINLLLILAGIFFVGSVVYSGIMLVQASSDDVAAKAKKNLTWSVIGAVIVILSNWIVPFIIGIISASLI